MLKSVQTNKQIKKKNVEVYLPPQSNNVRWTYQIKVKSHNNRLYFHGLSRIFHLYTHTYTHTCLNSEVDSPYPGLRGGGDEGEKKLMSS